MLEKISIEIRDFSKSIVQLSFNYSLIIEQLAFDERAALFIMSLY